MKSHTHHTIPRSRGGTDESWNLVELDPYTHAYEHALDFVLFDHAPRFDFRHEAWALLPEDLKEAVKKRHAEWNSNYFTGITVTDSQRNASRENVKIATSSRSKEQNVKQGKVNGRRCAELGLGVCAPGYGNSVSENMKTLVSMDEHWFQTKEHSERVSKSNSDKFKNGTHPLQQPCECPVCGIKLKTKGGLGPHMRTHTK